MLQKVIKTHYADRTDAQGRWREAVWCDLACGHFVVVAYHTRRDYRRCRCPWCAREKAEGVKYVRPKPIGGKYQIDAPDFVPEGA